MYYYVTIMEPWQRNLCIAFVFAGFLLLAGYIYQRISERRDRHRNPAPGRLVSVGDHRLHLFCKGSGAPTVVIEQGAGSPSRLWWPVQDKVAEFASVCTYDRAGYLWSDPAPPGRTIAERAEELHTLLVNSGIPGPYVLVAHSYGGLIVRSFARTHPDQVAGLVLVDTPDETTIFQENVLTFYSRVRVMSKAVEFAARFGLLRMLGACFPAMRAGFPFSRAGEYAAAADDLASLQSADQTTRRPGDPGSLGDLPLAVITHGQPFPGPFAILEPGWVEGQKRLAALSTNSQVIPARKSNHMIHLDEPNIVIDSIHRVHEAACNHTRLADSGHEVVAKGVR
jgi:pimeloyl-ACP methyl ester carboxylesterase